MLIQNLLGKNNYVSSQINQHSSREVTLGAARECSCCIFCRYIDVSQAVEPNHPHGLEFLYRDCKNVSDFFSAKGVHQCLSPAAMFTSITGLPIDESGSEAEILTQVFSNLFLNYLRLFCVFLYHYLVVIDGLDQHY